MVRIIRLVGAALGALIGLSLVLAEESPFEHTGSQAILIPIWVAAWIATGFLLLPYLTVVPAGRLIRGVQAMSTAEFVAAVAGLVIGLLIALLLGLPLSILPDPYGHYLPIGISICFGLGMLGLTVAKREDLVAAAEAAGLLHRSERKNASAGGETLVVVDTSAIIDGRIADIVDFGFPLPPSAHTALRPRGTAADRRQLGHAASGARPARPGDPGAAPEGGPDAG